MPGAIFLNPHSGPDPTSVAELREVFPGHDVEECDPDDITECVKRALADGAEFVGVAGGDGTIRCAAEVLAGGDVPLLSVPAGTRNHFARQLGIANLDAAHAAVEHRHTQWIDLGRVNDACFLNNSSIGLYAKLVRRREAHQHRYRKTIANVLAAWEQLRHGHHIRVAFDGEEHRAWMVFVGNGRYGEGLLDLIEREGLDDGVLDVRVVLANQRLARLRVVGALLFGRLEQSPTIITRSTRQLTLELRRGEVDVAVDGEVLRMSSPLRYESVPRALAVLVPPRISS